MGYWLRLPFVPERTVEIGRSRLMRLRQLQGLPVRLGATVDDDKPTGLFEDWALETPV